MNYSTSTENGSKKGIFRRVAISWVIPALLIVWGAYARSGKMPKVESIQYHLPSKTKIERKAPTNENKYLAQIKDLEQRNKSLENKLDSEKRQKKVQKSKLEAKLREEQKKIKNLENNAQADQEEKDSLTYHVEKFKKKLKKEKSAKKTLKQVLGASQSALNVYELYYDFFNQNKCVSLFSESTLAQVLMKKLYFAYHSLNGIIEKQDSINSKLKSIAHTIPDKELQKLEQILENLETIDFNKYDLKDDIFKDILFEEYDLESKKQRLIQLLKPASKLGFRTEYYLGEMDSSPRHSKDFNRRVRLNQDIINQYIKILELTLYHRKLLNKESIKDFRKQNICHRHLFGYSLPVILVGAEKLKDDSWGNKKEFEDWSFVFLNFCQWAEQIYRKAPHLQGYLESEKLKQEIFGNNNHIDTPHEILQAINGQINELSDIHDYHNPKRTFNLKSLFRGAKKILYRVPVSLLTSHQFRDYNYMTQFCINTFISSMLRKPKYQRPFPHNSKPLIGYLNNQLNEKQKAKDSKDLETLKKLNLISNYNFTILSELYLKPRAR